ncbi:Flp pilus assembly protein CpaB [Rhodosalinus sediminis]|uniref:Flp pilus assembly protein CpaB n=1 Tax=Rhodosalinus sediminis TaxID=1940533 RepID=UPI00235689B7|nr:Flp pilus assembly protein CpaB [Rhodosalinus sediminis]
MIRTFLFILCLFTGSAGLWSVLSQEADTGQPPPVEAVQSAAPAPPAVVTVPVLVAARDLQPGDRLTPEDLDWRDWPEDFVIDSFVLRADAPEAPASLAGRVTEAAFEAGTPLDPDSLRADVDNTLAAQLSRGMRAFSVRVNVETAAGGFVLPGDYVDIVYTIFPDDSPRAVSRVIASNVNVLALDSVTNIGSENSASGVGLSVERTATVALTPEQVEAVSAAQEDGRLTFALRSANDRFEERTATRPFIRVNRGGTEAREVP